MFHVCPAAVYRLGRHGRHAGRPWGCRGGPDQEVLGACDNTAGCSYSINDKTGDISGCSKTSGKCFYCPNDGKRQCFAIRQIPPPGKRPVVTARTSR